MDDVTKPSLDDIPGWFNPSDRALFRWVLEHQRDAGLTGNLVEMGAYLGKSAVVIGDYVGADETFTVIDLFESDAPDEHNASEMAGSYASLTRDRFEANYALFHDRAPEVFTAPSSEIVDHVAAGSCRFVHVDASHLYEHVAVDVDSAKLLLGPEGVVVFDDYRSEHTPGVSAAVWEAVLNKGLNPICVSESKLYATWSDAEPHCKALWEWIEGNPLAWGEFQEVAGHRMIRCKIKQPAAAPRPAPARKPAPAPRPAQPTGWRKVAVDWLPPKAVAGARRLRARRRG